MAKSDTNEKETRRRKSAGFRILYILFILLDLAAGCVLAVTGYAGYVSPLKHGGLWGVLPLGFGYAFWLCIALLVLQLLFYRRGALVLAILMLCSAGPVLTFFPVNAGTSDIPHGSESFTFLTYNVHNFVEPGQTESTDTMHNAQVEYILKTDADIVCLQEATWVGTFRPKFLAWNQREKLFENYPYVYVDGAELAVLSKFPVEAKHLDASSNFKSGHVICLHVTLPSSRIITVFDVHLQSMRLLNEDREVYMQMTELHRPHIHDIKNKLFDKLSEAAINRAYQAQQLMRYIRLYGGPDVILSGDFNDVPGCYTIHKLDEAGFRSVYPEVGFGPLITFNDWRLYFCIDHTLYRGAITPVKMEKGSIKASDHYPLKTTFYIKN